MLVLSRKVVHKTKKIAKHACYLIVSLSLPDIIIFINRRTVKPVEKERHSNELKGSHNDRVARRMRERLNLDWRFG